jgi:hypothetical protein
MRATPPPAALPVAAAVIPLVVAVLVPLAVPSAALAERWLRPVPGEVARSFDYSPAAPFARGAHRGADLAARPGTPVRAACSGRVVHAGRIAGDGVVSVRCGTRRVSYLPVDAVRVRAGARVPRGARVGRVAPGHAGLHLGVRREGDPFAYEDPLALLSRPVPPPPLTTLPRPARRLRPPAPAPRLAPAPAPAPRLAPAPRGAPAPAPRATAPWPVWLGLALLLSGAAGSGTFVVRRRRRAALRPLPAAIQSTR